MYNQWDELVSAIQEGDVLRTAILLEDFEDINEDHEMLSGGTLLRLITFKNATYLNTASVILEKGVDPNAVDNNKSVALHDVCSMNNVLFAELLLEYGALVDIKDSSGWTPLHTATSCGFIDSIKLLLKHGACVNAITDKGWTPLHMAALCGSTECVEFLLEQGARVDITNKNGKTAGDVAANLDYHNVVSILENSDRDLF